MSVQALICTIAVRPHPNAQRLQIGLAASHQVIVDLSTQGGEVGVFFPPNAQLSEEFCRENNLFREGKGTNKDPSKNGYMEESRRVRTIKLRRIPSEGIWLPLDSLAYTGVDLSTLVEGFAFNELNGKPICQKYFSPATQRAMKAGQPKQERIRIHMFHEHYDTKQLRYYLGKLPETNFRVVITEKCHGTSGRTGHVQVDKPLARHKKFWNKYLGWTGLLFPPDEHWRHVSGTRRVVLESTFRDGWHGGNFRQEIHETISLKKGETIYYEVVGWEGPGGATIMATHSLGTEKGDEIRKELAAKYNTDKMTYSYGCAPGTYRVLVYRITVTNEDGDSTELSWDQIVARCEQLGHRVVPVLFEGTVYNREELVELCRKLSSGPSTLDPTHVREGVCVRIEHPSMFGEVFKWKGIEFCHLEGIAQQDVDYVDAEDAS